MGSFIAKQPNGLYCRFSTVVDCPTDWNMTEEDYINMCMEMAKVEAMATLQNHVRGFENVTGQFLATNMTLKEWKAFLSEVEEDNNVQKDKV